jgi:hypothetical protein
MEDLEFDTALVEAMDEVLEEGKIQQVVQLPTNDHNRTYILVDNGPDFSAPAIEPWIGIYTDCETPYEFCRRCYTHWPPEPVRWVQDDARDELCCCGCGSVRVERVWPTTSYSSCHKYTNLPSKSNSAGVLYKRRYHFHERLSQRNNTDPRVPYAVVRQTAAFLASGTGGRPIITPYEYHALDRATLHDALRSIGHKKYCERWVQVKYRLLCGQPPELDEYGVVVEDHAELPEKWPHKWLTDHMQLAFRSYFDAVSAAFDALLFRAGRKQTLKLNATRSNDGPLARHNM